MPLTVLSDRSEPSSQRGVMLLEALISIAIFSIAVLGLIGLQSAAIRNTSEARQRAVAAFYANQIVGQMWMDHATLAEYAHRPGGEASTATCSFSGNESTNENVGNWIDAVSSDFGGAAFAEGQQIVVGENNVVKVTLCWKNPQEAVYHWFTAVAQIQGTQG